MLIMRLRSLLSCGQRAVVRSSLRDYAIGTVDAVNRYAWAAARLFLQQAENDRYLQRMRKTLEGERRRGECGKGLTAVHAAEWAADATTQRRVWRFANFGAPETADVPIDGSFSGFGDKAISSDVFRTSIESALRFKRSQELDLTSMKGGRATAVD
jgi:hypothetical protein